MKVGDKVQVNLPPFQDLLASEFVGLAKNLAYIVDFEEHKSAFDFSATTFTIDARAGMASTSEIQDLRLDLSSEHGSCVSQYGNLAVHPSQHRNFERGSLESTTSAALMGINPEADCYQ